MTNSIEIRSIEKKYKGFTLENIDFDLPKGCIMGLIGENGAGKTTIIKLILDLITASGGEISVLGQKRISRNSNVKEHIGVVMEDSIFHEELKVKDIHIMLKASYKTWDSDKFNGFMNKFKLPIDKKIKEFSKGMKMKLMIASALSHDSKVLILDEATSGLDPIVRDEILDVFLDFISNDENSILMSSHIISDLEKACDYITFIHDGKIIFSEEKDNILHKYALIKCSNEVLEALDEKSVIGARKNSFGAEVLVIRDKIPTGIKPEFTTIEDIMLYFVKGGNKDESFIN